MAYDSNALTSSNFFLQLQLKEISFPETYYCLINICVRVDYLFHSQVH